MNIGRSISNIFKGNPGQLLARTAGIAGLTAVVYDAHSLGLARADQYTCEKSAKLTDQYVNNTMYVPNLSEIHSKIKNSALNFRFGQSWHDIINSGTGYVKGFGSMLVEHVIPFGLSLGALLTRGKAAKVCAGALGIFAAGEFIRNFFGIGVPKGPIQ